MPNPNAVSQLAAALTQTALQPRGILQRLLPGGGKLSLLANLGQVLAILRLLFQILGDGEDILRFLDEARRHLPQFAPIIDTLRAAVKALVAMGRLLGMAKS